MRASLKRQLRHYRPLLSAIAGLGLLAAAAPLLALLRPLPLEERAATRIIVVSSEDEGPGSLREAIFRANQAVEGVHIECRAPAIRLRSPLPPLIARPGTALAAQPGSCSIDASELEGGTVLELRTPDSRVSGLEIRGASGNAILLRAQRISLNALSLVRNDVGIAASHGAGGIVIRESFFDENRLGVELHAEAGDLVVTGSRFRNQLRSGVWAVRPTPPEEFGSRLVVEDNRFEGGLIGAVVLNVPARITQNEIRSFRFAAIYASGPRIDITGNRLHRGDQYGILGDSLSGALIEGNEISEVGAVALMLRYGRNSVVRANRVYRNAYGIASILGEEISPNQVVENMLLGQHVDGLFVLAESPMIRGNVVRGSTRAALRIVDLLTRSGDVERAEPLVEDNRFDHNGSNFPIHERHQPLPGPEAT